MTNKNIIAVALVSLVAIVAGIVALIILSSPDDSSVGEYLSILVTVVVVPIVTALLGLLKDQHETTKNTNDVVNKLANGEMDAKIERVVRQVFYEYKGEPPDSTSPRR